MRPQAGVDRLKPVPPMHANDLPLVAQAVSPAYRILSQLLSERAFVRTESPLLGRRLETRDAALRSHGPPVTARHAAHGVVRAAIEELPGLAVAPGDVGSGSAGDDPELASGQPCDGGTEAFRAGVRRRRPGAAAIVGEGDVLTIFAVLGVIAANGDAVARVAEGEREDAGGIAIIANRRYGDRQIGRAH